MSLNSIHNVRYLVVIRKCLCRLWILVFVCKKLFKLIISFFLSSTVFLKLFNKLFYSSILAFYLSTDNIKIRYHVVWVCKLLFICVWNVGKRSVNNRDKSKQNDHCDDHWQTACHRVYARLGVKVHLLFLHLLLVFSVFLLYLFKLRLKHGHSCRALLLLDVKRKYYKSCKDSEKQQCYSVVLAYKIAALHYPAQRGRNNTHLTSSRSIICHIDNLYIWLSSQAYFFLILKYSVVSLSGT